MKLQCIIVDDEPLALELLEDNIKQVPFLKLVAKCTNAVQAMKILQSMSVDVVFTDIQMPGLNGLQLIESLTTRPMFIFVTAYEKYALDGYKLDVVDYLVKPVIFSRFIQACNKAYERHNSKKILSQRHLVTLNENNKPNHIFVQANYSLVKIVLDEVSHIEAKKDYVQFYFSTQGKRPLLVRMSMKSIEDMLPPDTFIRTHRSFIVNADKITTIRKNSVFIGSTEFAVSEQYKAVLDMLTKGS